MNYQALEQLLIKLTRQCEAGSKPSVGKEAQAEQPSRRRDKASKKEPKLYAPPTAG